jgi:hypothetical protein
VYSSDDTNWDDSTVNIDSLCDWLRLRNFQGGFFISGKGQVDKIADPSNEFYAPKLAAAVRAWNEVTADPEALIGKTPKKALEIWLRKHASEYGLTGKDGNPNEIGDRGNLQSCELETCRRGKPNPSRPSPDVAKSPGG